jgi:hypothetical protein
MCASWRAAFRAGGRLVDEVSLADTDAVVAGTISRLFELQYDLPFSDDASNIAVRSAAQCRVGCSNLQPEFNREDPEWLNFTGF